MTTIAKKNKGGRPTTYKSSYCEKLIEYFRNEEEELPTLYKFASDLGVCRETLRNWAEKHPEFLGAIKQAKEIQSHTLLTKALNGDYASGPAIFAMKNLMDWRDRQEVETTGTIQHNHAALTSEKVIEKQKSLGIIEGEYERETSAD